MQSRRKREWIVLADQAHARIYIRDSRKGPLTLHADMSHPPAQKRQNHMGSDRPGRVQESMNSQRHSYEDHASFPTQESQVFLRTVSEEIDRGGAAGEMDRLILIALPKTRQILKSFLGNGTLEKLAAEYSKNLTGVAVHTLNGRIARLQEEQKEKQK